MFKTQRKKFNQKLKRKLYLSYYYYYYIYIYIYKPFSQGHCQSKIATTYSIQEDAKSA